MREALYYRKETNTSVRCLLCPHNCLIGEGKTGICRVRINKQGILCSGVYGRIAAMHTDPIEKKPLYHFYPGSKILSVGTPGCNFKCTFCQNYQLAHGETYDSQNHLQVSPQKLVDTAKTIPGNIGIAYTYNEPVIFYEMMLDTAQLAREAGLKNVVVSNGYINREPLIKLLEVTDAFNIDLKAFNDVFYRQVVGGEVAPVLSTLKEVYYAGKHLEITMLVIPTLNDSPSEFSQMVDWISTELSPDIPLHLSRYYPTYKMALPYTPEETLSELAGIAAQKLHYVFLGNVSGNQYSGTLCKNCGYVLIRRDHYTAETTGITKENECVSCGTTTGLKCI